MQNVAIQQSEKQNTVKKNIESLPVVRNFRRVIEARDMSLMNKELYQFLNLYCGFIAHYNILGFRDTYASPRQFADVFIRHFDCDHQYFCRNYACHEELYQNTGFTKAEIKREFFRIVERKKESIAHWADGIQKAQRYAVFSLLKKEFEGQEQLIHMECELCGESFDFEIRRNGQTLDNLCCLFCGQPIRTNNQGGNQYVERTI